MSRERISIDRLPPHSTEAEQGVLGCCLLDPNTCIGVCVEKLKDGSVSFYDLRHQTIFAELALMSDDRTPVDLLTIRQRLKDKQVLEQVGGEAYLLQIQDAVPSAANLSYYLDIVIEKYTLRRLISTCTNVVGKVYDYEGEIDELLEEVEQEILKIRTVPAISRKINELMHEATSLIEQRAQNWDLVLGLSTGLSDLDRLTDGLHGGEFVVIGAPTSCGKTALALNIIVHNALKGICSGFLSAEMTAVRLALRSLCSEARVNFKQVCESDLAKLTSSVAQLSAAPIHIDSINGMSIGQVRAIGRRMKQQHDIKLLAIENVQLLTGTGDNREQEIASISRGLKGMALELNIPVLGLSQLNDEGKLRESRAIGHDADSAWIITNDGVWQPKIQPVILKVEKCRDGETGNVKLNFLKTITRFEQVAQITDDDIPTNHND